ncbi:thiosulfate/3-mercaptopyruvate sulfurtransferase [Rhodovulum iodosum]|uniref:Thiosulfate/3-mercaptopyruvate sulfurtransferase n=1 Tax=Rhodovulum iodosum TaxID=68291 RepID=A0ABV3XV56_9RHOB|nr:sulfurtransferase [Rhodovulum robiginosum]RSK33619.1 sulfurtransferase [Rhodovulum robiginosum]
MDTLVSTDWLSRHLDDPDLVVLDCMVRTDETEAGIENRSGLEDCRRGHIPTAGFADLKGALCDQDGPVEFALPSPETFCAAMGRLGVGDASRVVLYDALMSAWAARVWWMLRWVGFDRAAILDGGLTAWTAEGRPLSTQPAAHAPKRLTPRPRPRLIADRDEVRAAIADETVRLIDTLPAASYRGEMALYGRPGHVPTAINVPGTELVDGTGRFRPLSELGAMHGFDRGQRAITYCGGGILASANAFVMTRLGFRDVAVYTASLQEWAADPSNPMTVDA